MRNAPVRIGGGLVGLGGLVVLGWLVWPQSSNPKAPEVASAGGLSQAECMSVDRYNSRAAEFVSGTDWSQVAGSAVFSASAKSAVGGIKTFEEMTRLGTRACPDLAPQYQRYLAASVAVPPPVATTIAPVSAAMPVTAPSAPSTASSVPTVVPAKPRATLTTRARIRSGPSTSTTIIRIAKKGDHFNVFDTKDGWIQVGDDKPEGWVSAPLVKQGNG